VESFMRAPRFTSLAVLGLLLALLAAACGGSSGGVASDAAAVAGGEKIAKADVDALLQQARAGYKAQGRLFPKAGSKELAELRNRAVEHLVQRALYSREASSLGVAVTDGDVQSRFAWVRDLYFEKDDGAYKLQLAARGLTEAQLRAEIRAELTAERVTAELTKDVAVSEADVQAYYNANRTLYTQPESRDVRHILVATRAKAERLRAELVAGADFAELVGRFSDDVGSKERGGRYDDVQRGQFVKPFERYLFSARTGELSQPVKTQFGWHLIEPLSDIRPAGPTPLAEVAGEIREQLLAERRSEAVAKWLEASRAELEVEYAPGYGRAQSA
jgi:foldase protein PrsA